VIELERVSDAAARLPMLLEAAKLMGFCGLNITYPFKQAAVSLLDELSDEARAIGAVNTVVIRNGRLSGHNTDSSGWRWGFEQTLPAADLSRVVLLGAGGAGSAIAHALMRMQTGHLVICDSVAARADALARDLARIYGSDRVASNTRLADAMAAATGLVHATPTGMAGLPGLPLPAALLHPALWVAEAVYFPLETALLSAARETGCATVDGGTMAVGQAIGAFELFTGCTADARRMKAHFHRLVAGRTDVEVA
jgi:shikimate dehydrogenase